jgi:hypothetical protein
MQDYEKEENYGEKEAQVIFQKTSHRASVKNL